MEYDIEILYSWSSNKTHLEHIRLEDVRIPEGSTTVSNGGALIKSMQVLYK